MHPIPPLDTLLPPHDMVTTIEPMQEGICPLVPTMERGVVVRVEVTKRQRVKVPRERSGRIRGWLVRRYMLTRTIARDPSVRTIQPSCTYPLEDRPNGGLVSTRPMCIRPASDSHVVWHAHRLPSPVIGHGTPHMTPRSFGEDPSTLVRPSTRGSADMTLSQHLDDTHVACTWLIRLAGH